VTIRRIISTLLLVSIGVVLVALAVANRGSVVVSFDPFDAAHPAFELRLPLYALLLAVAIFGVVIGGVAAWFKQSKWRRAARLAQARTHELDAELLKLRHQAGHGATDDQPPRRWQPQLTIPPPAA
jgi:uncharacterized integral membrane protein